MNLNLTFAKQSNSKPPSSRYHRGLCQIEIQDMKLALENLAKEYVDPASKNKIKEMCNLASR